MSEDEKPLTLWLGIATSAITVLAFFGITNWDQLFGHNSDGPPSPPASSSAGIPPLTGSSMDLVPTASSSSSRPAPPPTSSVAPPPPPSTTAFDWHRLDDAPTDPTPATAAAMLPQSFTDSQNVEYTLRSGGPKPCIGVEQSQLVRSVLSAAGCTNSVVGTYVDHSNQIMVSVWVVPTRDALAAVDADSQLRSAGATTDAWGTWCPASGPGSQICDDNLDWRRADQSGLTGDVHRYVLHTLAYYISLGNDPKAKPWINAAALGAYDAIGPKNNYP